MPDTAVLIGLEGKYSHWTTVDKVRSSIKLLDSGSIKQIPIRNIPQIHQISKNDVYVIKARVTAQQVEEIKALITNRIPITQIAKQYGISRRTVYNYINN